MKNLFVPRSVLSALWLALLLLLPAWVQAAPPDLTAAGVIAALKTDPNSTPVYGETYNLGPTGLRGWIYIGGGNSADGTFTGDSRQILVTVASTPGGAVLAVDDVILGAMAGSSGTVPLFISDCRKAFGVAIGDAEKTGAGTLRVKRWRAGTTTDVNIAMTIMGDYTATAPYTCPKSALILANARTKLVSQLLADPNFLTSDWAGAINGLALLAGVAPGDANYATVQTRLQTFARALAATTPDPAGLYVWEWGYIGLFLGEYYLSTSDANVVTGVNHYTVALAKVQSRYGTYNHTGALLKADGSLHGTCPPYGPVNQAGIAANMAIVMGKKALVAAGQAIDPEIDPAIQRGSAFFSWYVNKGPISYGEHEPYMENHSSNGKDALCAVFFGLQAGRTAETEYFSRMTIASFNAREDGHTGQGFNYLWGAMGANIGGSLAVAEYLKQVRWHLDLERRTDGSFVYDGQEGHGAGATADGTYLGDASGYYGMNPTACYILTYSLPLQRLSITGKNAIPANTLDAAKVANAIAAATFKQDCPGFTTTQLVAALSEFDPVVRNYCAIELGKRTLISTELTTLRGMVTGTNANGRMGACQTLGILKDATALPSITQRLDKNIETDSWVRAKAASALRSYGSAASTQRDLMLTAFTTNATDPEVIVWSDPIQIANNYLSFALFGDAVYGGNNIASSTINAPKNLLYPAVKAGLKQPDSMSRFGAAKFCYNYLTLPDVQELALDILEVITTKSQADPMWNFDPQLTGINILLKYKCAEGLPLALSMLNVSEGWGWSSTNYLPPCMAALVTYGDLARWTRPVINDDISILRNNLADSDFATVYPQLLDTIASISSATTSPSGIINLLPLASPQVVATTGAKAITLAGTSPRSAVTFTNVTAPAHGTLTGVAPNLTYTPVAGYTGPDSFTFQVTDSLTTSAPGTVSLIVGTAGTGLKGEYFDNADFTNLKLTRTDAQVNFDWGTGSPDPSIGADTFSVRWSGLLLVPETGTYTFSTLSSDGVRLYVNGVLVIDDFVPQPTHWTDGAVVNLTAGQLVDLQMEYYELSGSAVAKLKWTGPSFAGANGLPIAAEWLFDGAGVTSRTAYAHAQSLSLIENTAQTVTLTGSGGALTYSIVTQPVHGTLTGTAPNLTYTPAANFRGLDAFTFLVNNGTSNSAPATVSLAIWGALQDPLGVLDMRANGGINPATGKLWQAGDHYRLAFVTSATTQATSTNIATYNAFVQGVANSSALNLGGATWKVIGSTATVDARDNTSTNPSVNGTGEAIFLVDGITKIANNYADLWDGAINHTLDLDESGILFQPGPFTGSNSNGTKESVRVLGNTNASDLKVTIGSTTNTSAYWMRVYNAAPTSSLPVYALSDPLTVVADVPPTLTSLVDDKSGGPAYVNQTVTYTVTFSEAMNVFTVDSSFFENASATAITVNSVTPTADPAVFQVAVTPTAVGTLQLRIKAGAILKDLLGLALNTASAIPDDTIITVNPQPILACQLGILNLTANSGINPATNAAWAVGDKYRLAFLTRATIQATSANIATYNAFVQGVANSSTLNLGGANWKVIGSTATVDARDNTSTNASVNGTGEAIFLVDGTTKIANNYADLWDGSINHTLDLDERGVLFQTGPFTGSVSNGTKESVRALGNANASDLKVTIGSATNTTAYWIRVFNAAPSSSLPVYALSDPLTVIDSNAVNMPPTNLLAAPGNNHIGLTWAVSAGATGYYVKRSLTNGGPYTVIGNPNTASYNDLTAVNGTTYYYVVSAITAGGESVNSSQVSGIPAHVPSTTTLVSSPAATGPYGTAVTFTATVTVTGGPATGTVTFKDGTTELGTGTLDGTGQSSYTHGTLAVANHSITATYGGDTTFGGSVSAPSAYLVTPKALTLTGVTASNKEYNGNATAALTGGAVSSGLVGGETVTVVPGSGTFASPNAGTWAVTATGYTLGGAYAGNYVLAAQPTVPNASITPRPVVLTGTRTYDGTATAAAGVLTIQNNLDAPGLSLTGSATLAAKDVGTQGFLSGYATPVQVQNATGNSGTSSVTSFNVNLTTTPVSGNTLIAVISTRGTSAGRVSGITQTGATWSRATQAANSSGATTEIWYASNIPAGSGAQITINQASLRSAAVVVEYSGVLTGSPLDQVNNSTGSGTAAVTGTTAATAQPGELWIGGIGIADGRRTLNAPYGNAFTVAASPKSGATSSDAMVYALEKIVNTTGAASSSGTVSTSDSWSGAIATFKAASTTGLVLTGAAAGNYTLTGLTGSVAITPKNLTESGLAAGDRSYDGTAAAALTGVAALLPAQAAGSGTAADGKPYTGDNLTLGGTATGAFADKHAGNNKAITVAGVTFGGAQAGNYTFTQPAGLTATVTPLPLTVAAVSATKTYDGTTAAAGTPTLTPPLASGDTATVLAQAFQDPNAGTGKAIVPHITLNDGNSGANYAVTLTNCTTGTINKAAATVTLGGLAQTCDGSPKSATATTDPAGKWVNFTYDGSSTPPTAAGGYAVVATIDDPNYSGTATGTLVIAVEPLVAWRDAHFTAAEISAGLAADNADADGDGFTNLAEYTLGTDPRGFSPQPLAIAPAAGNHLTLNFVARRATGYGYAGLTRKYTVEGSADLANPTSWQPVTGYTDIVGDEQTVIVTLPATGPNKLYRLNIRVE